MGRLLNGTKFALLQYVEALLVTLGVATFFIASNKDVSSLDGSMTEPMGLLFCFLVILSKSFTLQWQERILLKHGRDNVDTLQMMLGISIWGTLSTTLALVISGDLFICQEFLQSNPQILGYLLIAAIFSTLGSFCFLYALREVSPVSRRLDACWKNNGNVQQNGPECYFACSRTHFSDCGPQCRVGIHYMHHVSQEQWKQWRRVMVFKI